MRQTDRQTFHCVYWHLVFLSLTRHASHLLCPRDLSSNHLTRLEESSFAGLSGLDVLLIGNNKVSFVADGAFRGLTRLMTL